MWSWKIGAEYSMRYRRNIQVKLRNGQSGYSITLSNNLAASVT